MKPTLRPCVVTHGGAANDPAVRDGCDRACAAAAAALDAGAAALDAAVAAVVVLEESNPRMNAGTGSTLRLDGRVQLDASVMDRRGFGAVAALDDTKNPVQVARAVYDLPHLLLVGDGATAFARKLGFASAAPPTEAQQEKHRRRLATLGQQEMWQGVDEKFWKDAEGLGGACDTVGAVVRDRDGNFAAAASTGGIWCALRGRVGDVPIPGAGLYVGARGAVACTGIGELIWREMMAVRLHDQLGGHVVDRVLDDAVVSLRARHPGKDVGFIAVDDVSGGAAVTGAMPWAMWVG